MAFNPANFPINTANFPICMFIYGDEKGNKHLINTGRELMEL